MNLLQKLIDIPSPSGDEGAMRDFIIGYIQKKYPTFRTKPNLIYGAEFQNCLAVQFGKPKVAVFAHMDTVAYMTGYTDNLLEMGSPEGESGSVLVGIDHQGPVECTLVAGKNKKLNYECTRPLDRGTQLTYKPYLHTAGDEITGTYLDNRVGIYNALRLAETLENGLLIFTNWEEHYGGSVGYMGRYIYEEFKINQVLISDVTWSSIGLHHGKGVAISLRDAGIPRREYVMNIIKLAKQSGIPFQIEVEQYGSSDGGELQRAPYPIDWCFIGPPTTDMHTDREKINMKDVNSMLDMYKYLMEQL
jgi:putative aminopeptidase FrvX